MYCDDENQRTGTPQLILGQKWVASLKFRTLLRTGTVCMRNNEKSDQYLIIFKRHYRYHILGEKGQDHDTKFIISDPDP